jgi:hypothetical protein
MDPSEPDQASAGRRIDSTRLLSHTASPATGPGHMPPSMRSNLSALSHHPADPERRPPRERSTVGPTTPVKESKIAGPAQEPTDPRPRLLSSARSPPLHDRDFPTSPPNPRLAPLPTSRGQRPRAGRGNRSQCWAVRAYSRDSGLGGVGLMEATFSEADECHEHGAQIGISHRCTHGCPLRQDNRCQRRHA